MNTKLTVAIPAAVMALLAGGLAAWAMATLELSLPAFLVITPVTGYVLLKKPLPSAAIGMGLYINSLILALVPILFYAPMVMQNDAASIVGGILGMLIWGFGLGIVAVVIFGVGKLFTRRAEKKLAAAEVAN